MGSPAATTSGHQPTCAKTRIFAREGVHINSPPNITTYAETIAAFSNYRAELTLHDLAPGTLTTYTSSLNSFQAWLADQPITPQNAKLHLAELRSQGRKPATIRLHYAVLKAFLAYQGTDLKLKLTKPRRLPPYHSTKQLIALLDRSAHHPHRNKHLAHRDTLIILTLALTGARRAELAHITPSNITQDFIHIRSGKGDKDRSIPLSHHLRGPLNAYIATHQVPPLQPIFPISPAQIARIVKQHATAAGINDLTPHALRHYCATNWLEHGRSLKAIQDLLGHHSIATTALYLDLIPQHLQSDMQIVDQDNALSTGIMSVIKTLYPTDSKESSTNNKRKKGGKLK
ncbi:Tyrosine recombinase XerC [subsurface metagenome]